jgi:exopolysaccharide biosynthesis polyprenyl glycosylphosphotransferase
MAVLRESDAVRTAGVLVPGGSDSTRLAAQLGRDAILRRLLAGIDGLAVLLAMAGTLVLSGFPRFGERTLWGLAAAPLMVLLFKIYGLYDRDVKRISHSTADDLPWLLHAVIVGSLLIWVYSKETPLERFDLQEVVTYGVLTLLLVTSGRFLGRTSYARIGGPEVALIVGGGSMAAVLASKLAAHPEYRSRVVGVLTDRRDEPAMVELPVLGSPGDLAQIALETGAARVIVSHGDIDESGLEELLRRCRALSLKVSVLPQLSDVLGPAVEIDDVEGVTVLGLNPPWLPRSSRALKRALDLLLAGALVILTAPLMALIALAIKLDSRGPVFFRQRRVGKAGARFEVLKFRTMVRDAEAQRAALLAQSKDPNWLHLEHDPRITRVGRFLRLSSLDELPQLCNVLKGEMSMVGPRPLIEAEDARVEDWARGRLDLTPGITGYWQVLGRTRIPFEEMVKLDYLYVMNWSLWNDIRLILRTLPTVVGRRGAN